MPHRGSDRRWSWYAQVRDALVSVVGIGVIALMAVRNSYPIGGVVTALVCVGALSASAALRALVGRWETTRLEDLRDPRDDRDEVHPRDRPAGDGGTP